MRLFPNLKWTFFEFCPCLAPRATQSASVGAQKIVIKLLVKTPHQPAQKINCFSWLIQKRISINWQLRRAICIRKTGVHSAVGHHPGEGATVNSQRSAEGSDPHHRGCQQWNAASAARLTRAFFVSVSRIKQSPETQHQHTQGPLWIFNKAYKC